MWNIISNADVIVDIRVAVLVAFSALLRVSEYTCPTMSAFVPGHTLKRCDVLVDDRFIRLDLHHSKTDAFNFGQHVYIFNHEDVHSAYTVLRQYLESTSHRSASSPLFMIDALATPRHVRRFVTRYMINACLKEAGVAMGMDVAYLSSHSLRIGGATALADADASDRDIQFAGRWRSDAFLKYIRVSIRRLAAIAKAVYVAPASIRIPVFPSVDSLVDVLDHTPPSPSGRF